MSFSSMQYLPEDDDETSFSSRIQTRHYYILPCFFLFDRSHKLLQLCLKMMGSLIKESYSSPSSHTESSSVTNDSKKITAVVSALLLMHKDAKVQKIISLFKAEMNHILEIALSSQVCKLRFMQSQAFTCELLMNVCLSNSYLYH